MMFFENFTQKHRFSSIDRSLNIVEACIEHPYVVFQSFKYDEIGFVYSPCVSTTSFVPMFTFDAIGYSDCIREDMDLINDFNNIRKKHKQPIEKIIFAEMSLLSWWAEFLIEEMKDEDHAAFFPIRDKICELYKSKTFLDPNILLVYSKMHDSNLNEDLRVYLINATKAIHREKEDIYEKLGEYFNERSFKSINEKLCIGINEMEDSACRHMAMDSVCMAYSKIKKHFDRLKDAVDPIVHKYQLWGIW